MTILLAPMEGLLDFVLRDVLTRVGGIDRCVSEFIRVTATLLPERSFRRILPELDNGGRTPSGVPAQMPVSAKMRLGYNDASRALECAQAIADSGADELVVHARTKVDGYRPPAYWERIREIRDAIGIPVVANGEIWTVEDALRCRELSGCEALMLGRGMVSDPGLALAIRRRDSGDGVSGAQGVNWEALQPQLAAFWQIVNAHLLPAHRAGRLKQWLNFLRRRHPEAEAAYQAVRRINEPGAIHRVLFAGFPGAEHKRLAA